MRGIVRISLLCAGGDAGGGGAEGDGAAFASFGDGVGGIRPPEKKKKT